MLDADVLVPILSCDLLLSASDLDLYRPVVTETILAETERNLLEEFAHLDPVALRVRVTQVAAALSFHTHAEGEVTAAAVASVNRKDRHVAATALANRADVVVRNDRRLRREINALAKPSVGAVTSDEFAQRLLADEPDGTVAVTSMHLSQTARGARSPAAN